MSAASAQLLGLHVRGTPLVLANAWDAASARAVQAAGLPAVATTSAGVAEANGFEDGGGMPAEVALLAVRRIAAAVDIPVTADIERGYGLAPAELAERLLDAGACGCNIEDSVNRVELDPGEQADFLAAVKEAAGADLVVNARVDHYVRAAQPDHDAALARATRYRAAGADCLYPIGLADLATLTAFAGIAPVNALYRKGVAPIAELAAAGVSRISVGSGVFRLTMERASAAIRALATGADPGF